VFGQLDRGQPGPEDAKPRIVVKAHQSEIIRTGQAHLFGSLQQADRHEVVRDINSIGMVREQRMSSSEAGLDPVVALHHQLWLKGQTLGLQGIVKALRSR